MPQNYNLQDPTELAIMQNDFEKDQALNMIANNLRLREDQRRMTAVYKLLQNVQLAHDKYIRFYDLQLVI